MANPKKRGLGKGLGALISDIGDAPESTREPAAVPQGDHQVLELDPSTIKPNPHQPRTHFDEAALQELAESVKLDGVQEPIIVRERGGHYELVTGERRVRACIMAGLDTVPAICREVSDSDMLKLGLIENIQRENLNAMETARGYHRLIEEFHWTQEELARQVGKNRVTVANMLRLINLPGDVQARVEDGSITMGHARALLAFPSAERQSAVCRKIVADGLSVRQVEKMASPPAPKAKQAAPKDPHLASIEDRLRRRFGTRVNIRASGKKKGKIVIDYFNLDDLERILEVLGESN